MNVDPLVGAERRCLWDERRRPRDPVALAPGDRDVVVVGGGFSGLWTAYWISHLDPARQVTILESRRVGHGASGRNGGWLSALLPVPLTDLASVIGEAGAVRTQSTMFATVSEIVDLCRRLDIDIDAAHGGSVALIRNAAQEVRARHEMADYERFGFTDHVQWLERSETRHRVRVDHESLFRPDCAVVHPRALVDGLARHLDQHGVAIHENCHVVSFDDGRVDLESMTISAGTVIDCREAYGARDSGRRVAPIHSSMIATPPLSSEIWDLIGLGDREALTDHRRQIVYAQRTADDRLAFGGRGVGYSYGSRISPSSDFDDQVHRQLFESMTDLFPCLRHVGISHRWGGPLGVPRDWTWSVSFDHRRRTGRLGGYVGDGVTSTYVAARALAQLVVHGESDFPLVDHRSRRWEPEPLRWFGINSMNRLSAIVDRREAANRQGGILGRLLDALVG